AAIKGVEGKMAELSRADPQVERLRAIAGMGTTLALTILGHSGDFSRFRSHDAYAAYCGLAPAVWQSGQSRVYARRRHRYSRPLRQAFLQLALIQSDPEFLKLPDFALLFVSSVSDKVFQGVTSQGPRIVLKVGSHVYTQYPIQFCHTFWTFGLCSYSRPSSNNCRFKKTQQDEKCNEDNGELS
ncbi:hypothetical protein DRN75_01595, partial [Nanoarchaeota archaeon]